MYSIDIAILLRLKELLKLGRSNPFLAIIPSFLAVLTRLAVLIPMRPEIQTLQPRLAAGPVGTFGNDAPVFAIYP